MFYPDIPSRELDPIHLGDMPGWFVKLKLDGWRCIVQRHSGVVSYFSKTLKPLKIKDSVRLAFESYLPDCNLLLDCELTGNRREGDAAAIFVLDIMDRSMTAIDRMRKVSELFPAYAVEWKPDNFKLFFDSYKSNPLAEGVVLFKSDSRYIGCTTSPAKSKSIIKCKWRAGMSGTTFK